MSRESERRGGGSLELRVESLLAISGMISKALEALNLLIVKLIKLRYQLREEPDLSLAPLRCGSRRSRYLLNIDFNSLIVLGDGVPSVPKVGGK